MRELDFHIDEPILHDAAIESKMDFEALLSASVKSNTMSLMNLSFIWTIAVFSSALLVFGLNYFNNGKTIAASSDNIRQEFLVQGTQPLNDASAIIIAPVDSLIEEVIMTESPNKKETNMIVNDLPKVRVNFKQKSTLKKPSSPIKLESIDLPKAQRIESERADLIVEENVQIPRGFPISVDIKTYSDLKHCDYYYFELVEARKDEATLKAENWESGDLIFHPEKNKFNLILTKGARKKQVVVRLIKGNVELRRPRFWVRKK